jgi:hypothetical protein
MVFVFIFFVCNISAVSRLFDIMGRHKGKLRKKDTKNKALDLVKPLLDRAGLSPLEVQPDGNCLFRSFAQAHCLDQSQHLQYRQKCCDYMAANESEFKDFVLFGEGGEREEELRSFESYGEYIDHMRCSGVWGTQLELTALCSAYKSAAVVFRTDGTIYELGNTDLHAGCVVLIHDDNCHFNVVDGDWRTEVPSLVDVKNRLDQGCAAPKVRQLMSSKVLRHIKL